MINVSKLYCGLAGESDELRYSEKKTFGPVVVFNCTAKCNLKCLHCYSSSVYDHLDKQLSTIEAKKLIADIANAGSPVILFSGGEPLLRKDLLELLKEAKKNGLCTVISTNGTLIDSAAAEKLADTGLDYVGISLDGEEKAHDKFRGVTGSFKATMKGMENCRKAGLKTGLRFTITKQNADQVPAVFDIAASASIRRICFYHLIHTGRATQLESQTPQPQHTRRIIDIVIQNTEKFTSKGLIDEVLTVGNHADGPYLLLKMQKQNKPAFGKAKELLLINGGNKIGENIACVSWNGNIYPDQFWRNYSVGNVKEKSFSQIWQNPTDPVLKKLRNKTKFADKRCLRCMWFDLCKGNFRFLGTESDDQYWLNEPECYLTDDEITG